MDTNSIPNVVVAIVQKSGQFLIVKRKRNESTLRWQFPGGTREQTDKVESDTAERETLEETNVVCKATRRIGARIHPETKARIAYWLCDYVRGTAEVKATAELEEVRWGTGKEVTEAFSSDLYPPIKKYLENLESSRE